MTGPAEPTTTLYAPGTGRSRPSWRTAARRTSRLVAHGVGRATWRARMRPAFLVMGGQRCGTTTTFKLLSQHPAVLPAVLQKGVHYFDVAYDKGMPWYLGHFPTRRAARSVQRREGAALTGESSPYYLHHPLAPARIARDLPEVRAIVLVRDPVERAYSAHAHELARGFESEPFERALELEAERIAGEHDRLVADPSYDSHHWRHNAYVTRGQYVEQLERVERAFGGRERILVVDSHDLFAEPQSTFAGVLEHLGLPAADAIRYQRHNARSRSPMPKSLRRRLDEHFLPYDERLAAWWGRTPSWRR